EAVVLYWILLLAAVSLMVVLWGAGVSVVSRAGIIRPARRLAVIVVLIPATLALIVGLPLVVWLVGGGILAALSLAESDSLRRYLPLTTAALGLQLMLLPVMRRASWWALRDAKVG